MYLLSFNIFTERP